MSFIRFVAALKERDLLEDMKVACFSQKALLGEAWGPSKLPTATNARAACWAKLREIGLSYPEIGMIWGRDHATVLRAVKRFEARR